MAAGDTDIGTGLTLTFAGFTAEIVNLDWGGIEVPEIDTTHMGTTTARTGMPGRLAKWGEVTVDCHLKTNEKPPVNTTAALTVTYPDGTTWAASDCFLTGFSLSAPLEDKMTSNATFSVNGDVTVT